MSLKMTTADPTTLMSISSASFVVNDEAADSSVAIGVVVGIMIVFAVVVIIIVLRRAMNETRVMGANENRVAESRCPVTRTTG